MAEGIGTLQPVMRNDENDIDDLVKSTDTVGAGTLRLIRNSASSPYYSVVKWYKAGASITKGAALVHDIALSVDPNQLYKASTTQAGWLAAGIAAAAVSNTGYFSYCYVYGWCPSAIVGTAIASAQILTIAGTNNGLGALSIATSTTAVNTNVKIPFAINHWANSDAATLSSITIQTWLA